jgi:hypothetical protein
MDLDRVHSMTFVLSDEWHEMSEHRNERTQK